MMATSDFEMHQKITNFFFFFFNNQFLSGLRDGWIGDKTSTVKCNSQNVGSRCWVCRDPLFKSLSSFLHV